MKICVQPISVKSIERQECLWVSIHKNRIEEDAKIFRVFMDPEDNISEQ